jgi:hypothetical protein
MKIFETEKAKMIYAQPILKINFIQISGDSSESG